MVLLILCRTDFRTLICLKTLQLHVCNEKHVLGTQFNINVFCYSHYKSSHMPPHQEPFRSCHPLLLFPLIWVWSFSHQRLHSHHLTQRKSRFISCNTSLEVCLSVAQVILFIKTFYTGLSQKESKEMALLLHFFFVCSKCWGNQQWLQTPKKNFFPIKRTFLSTICWRFEFSCIVFYIGHMFTALNQLFKTDSH